MLDYSRTFPCEKPNDKTFPGGHLYRLFRPEFVTNFKFFPLCSDAYSRFITTQEELNEHNNEIDNATKELINVVIPNFARELLQLMEIEVKLKGTFFIFYFYFLFFNFLFFIFIYLFFYFLFFLFLFFYFLFFIFYLFYLFFIFYLFIFFF